MSLVTTRPYYSASTGTSQPDVVRHLRRDQVALVRSTPAPEVELTDSERLARVETSIDSLAAEVRDIAVAVDGNQERLAQLDAGLNAILSAIGELRAEVTR